MKPFILLLTPVLLTGAGCLHFQPIGPLAKQMGAQDAGATRPAPGVKVMPAKDAATVPILPAPPPPNPPSALVAPGEVSEGNSDQAAKRLLDELDADRKAMDRMPRYGEVSVVKGRADR